LPPRTERLSGTQFYDLRKNASQAAIDEEVRQMGLTRLSELMTKWTFHLMLLKRAYTDEAMQRMCAQSRFGQGELPDDGIGFELRLAKPASA
jgi:hypothetical protein